MVELVDLSFTYAGASRATLSNVTLSLPSRGVVLITGPLGAGCSTLLQVVAGAVPQLIPGEITGTATVLGQDPTTRDGQNAILGRVGLLLPTPWVQLSGMGFSVFDEVAFGLANLGLDRMRIHREVDEALATMEVEHLRERDPGTLSGGELQRVMAAAVLAMRPDLLLMDEPAVEMDGAGREAVLRAIANHGKDRLAVIASTDVDTYGPLADRVVLLGEGRLAMSGGRQVLASATAAELASNTTVSRIMNAAGDGGDRLFVEEFDLD